MVYECSVSNWNWNFKMVGRFGSSSFARNSFIMIRTRDYIQPETRRQRISFESFYNGYQFSSFKINGGSQFTRQLSSDLSFLLDYYHLVIVGMSPSWIGWETQERGFKSLGVWKANSGAIIFHWCSWFLIIRWMDLLEHSRQEIFLELEARYGYASGTVRLKCRIKTG